MGCGNSHESDEALLVSRWRPQKGSVLLRLGIRVRDTCARQCLGAFRPNQCVSELMSFRHNWRYRDLERKQISLT